jgi:hypothetical protein
MTVTDDKVVPLHPSEDDRARRNEEEIFAEVRKKACLSEPQWLRWVSTSGVWLDQHGIDAATMTKMIRAQAKENEDEAREREKRYEAQKREQQRINKDAERKRKEADKDAEKQEDRQRRDQKREQDEQRREQERADKEAEKKRKEREKELKAIAKLPRLAHEAHLAKLAERLDEDLDFLRAELESFIAPDSEGVPTVEPWPEPIDLNQLLIETQQQIERYLVIHDKVAAPAVTLWIAFAWMHEIAVHSPILEFRGAEPGVGKTQACGVIRFLSPRGFAGTNLTGPSLYRFVDREKPTYVIDNIDTLFPRRPDLVEVINVSWTRGTKIPRQEQGHTRWYDPFCPKVLAGTNTILPKDTETRCITIRLLPKLPDEKVEKFKHVDDDTLTTLRSKFARFTIDHAATIRDAVPDLSGFNNRAKDNFEVLTAIADLADGDWPQLIRAAARHLAYERDEPSEGKRLLRSFQLLGAEHGPLLKSSLIGKQLAAIDDEWANFHNKGRAINKFEVAILLRNYPYPKSPHSIRPTNIYPRGSGQSGVKGYDLRWPAFQLAFKHYLPETPVQGRMVVCRPPTRKPRKPHGKK